MFEVGGFSERHVFKNRLEGVFFEIFQKFKKPELRVKRFIRIRWENSKKLKNVAKKRVGTWSIF